MAKGVLVLPTVIAGLNDYALAVTFHQEIYILNPLYIDMFSSTTKDDGSTLLELTASYTAFWSPKHAALISMASHSVILINQLPIKLSYTTRLVAIITYMAAI